MAEPCARPCASRSEARGSAGAGAVGVAAAAASSALRRSASCGSSAKPLLPVALLDRLPQRSAQNMCPAPVAAAATRDGGEPPQHVPQLCIPSTPAQAGLALRLGQCTAMHGLLLDAKDGGENVRTLQESGLCVSAPTDAAKNGGTWLDGQSVIQQGRRRGDRRDVPHLMPVLRGSGSCRLCCGCGSGAGGACSSRSARPSSSAAQRPRTLSTASAHASTLPHSSAPSRR
jgi:hypothetical protein